MVSVICVVKRRIESRPGTGSLEARQRENRILCGQEKVSEELCACVVGVGRDLHCARLRVSWLCVMRDALWDQPSGAVLDSIGGTCH